MEPLAFPVRIRPVVVGRVRIDRQYFVDRFGPPGFVETDSMRTAGGNESNWAFVFDDQQKVLIEYADPYGEALIYAEPPVAEAAFRALGLGLNDPRVEVFDPPVSP